MSDNFNQHCRRRLHTRPVVELFGAGSGGDPGSDEDATGCKWLMAQKALWAVGNQIHLKTSTSAETPGPYEIEMLAADSGGDNGRIAMRGSQSVRITSGVPESSGGPAISSKSTNGVTVRAGDGQKIVLAQGDGDLLSNLVILNTDEDEGMLIRTLKKITINAVAGIELSVGATTSIKLTPSGIVMKGPMIRIN
jgi:hypothetical protein